MSEIEDMKHELAELKSQISSIKQATNITEQLDDPVSIITPFESDLTAPIAASAEYTKWYITATRIFKLYARYVHVVEDENGNEHVQAPPELKFWADYIRKILNATSKITASREEKIIDKKHQEMQKFIEKMPKEKQDELAEMVYKEMKENFGN